MRLWLAIKCFFLILFTSRLPPEAASLLPSQSPGQLPPREAELVDEEPKSEVGLARTQPMTAPPPTTNAASANAATTNAATTNATTNATTTSAATTNAAAKSDGDGANAAVQLLAILQREGRLLDFLQEDVDAYSDAQIGAAVRDIHRGCKKALAEHLPVEPVLREAENAQVRVDAGFDPSRIRLVGNVVGEPPFTGALRHHGWRVARVTLPTPARATDPSVIAPAEVELA
jgi:hypothetical protein